MSATATESSSAAETATAETTPADAADPEASLTDKQQRILAYLREHADAKTYFKSRLIGDALDMSAKEVGTNMPALREGEVGLTVEKWGYSSATTWKVTT